MGIKTFLTQKRCVICLTPIPYAWKRCQKHSPRAFGIIPSNREVKKEIKLAYTEISAHLCEDLHFKCDKKKALASHVLLYDENMDIIGYYSPLYMLNKWL